MSHPRFPVLSGILLAALPAFATSYHFAPSGDDSRSAAAAGNPATPWRSLSRLSTVQLGPGDSILLVRDGIWRETMVVSRSGSAAAPIVVAPYGPGSGFPEIRGSDLVAGRDSAGEVSAPMTVAVKGLSIGGERLRVARYPDAGWLYARMVGDTELVASGLPGSDWTGASLHMRTAQWALETRPYRLGGGDRLVFGRTYYVRDTVGFYLSNHRKAFGNTPSWFQDPGGTLHWKFPPGMSNRPVEAAVRASGVDLDWVHDVAVQGLRITGTTNQAIWAKGFGFRVEGCEIVDPGLVGIRSTGRDVAIVGNRIRGADNGAIVASGARNVVRGNVVRSTAQAARLGPDGIGYDFWGARSVDLVGDSGVVRRNDIDSTGYSGVSFLGIRSFVDSNRIAHSCMLLDDCGGIYTQTGKFRQARPGVAGSRIRDNVIHDGMAAPDGVKGHSPGTNGIYLDDGTHDVVVERNTVYRHERGIYLHNDQNCTLRVNTLYHNQGTQISMSHDSIAGVGSMSGNSIQDNEIVAGPGQAVLLATAYNGMTAPEADWRGNRVCTESPTWIRCDLDDHPLWSITLAPDTSRRLGPETMRNFGFDTARLGWTVWPLSSVLALDSGAACGTGRCAKIVHAGVDLPRQPLLYSNREISTDSGWTWLLSFRARARKAGLSCMPTLRRGYGDYRVVGEVPYLAMDTAWSRFEVPIRVVADEPRARLDFHSGMTDSVYWLDDVSFRMLLSPLVDTLPASRILVSVPGHPPGGGDPFPAPDGWVDLGNSPTIPADPGPYRSRILLPTGRRSPTVPDGARNPGAGVRIHRTAGVVVVDGLRGPATIYDGMARVVDRIVPDTQGRGTSKVVPRSGLVWLRFEGGTLPFFVP